MVRSTALDADADVVPVAPAPARRRGIARSLRRAFRRERLVIHGAQLLIMAAVLVAWQVFSGRPDERWTLVDSFYVGTPMDALEALRGWIRDGSLWHNARVTLEETVKGFGVGCLFGVVVGFVLGISRTLGQIMNPFITAFNTIPKLALLPLLILWFGLGTGSKVAMAALLVFFLVFVNTYTGVRDVDEDLIDVMKVMGARRWQLYYHVIAPSAMVWVVAGLKISVSYAFLGSVVAEMFASSAGLGMLIQRAGAAYNPSAMFAAIFVLLVLAAVINAGVSAIEHVALRWKRAGRDESNRS